MVAHLCIYHILSQWKRSCVYTSKHKSVKCRTYPAEPVFFPQVVIEILESLPGFTVVAYLEELYTKLHDTMSGGPGYRWQKWWDIPGLWGTSLRPAVVQQKPTPSRHPQARALRGIIRHLYQSTPNDLPSRPPRITMKLHFLTLVSPATSVSTYFPRRFPKPSASFVSP